MIYLPVAVRAFLVAFCLFVFLVTTGSAIWRTLRDREARQAQQRKEER